MVPTCTCLCHLLYRRLSVLRCVICRSDIQAAKGCGRQHHAHAWTWITSSSMDYTRPARVVSCILRCVTRCACLYILLYQVHYAVYLSTYCLVPRMLDWDIKQSDCRFECKVSVVYFPFLSYSSWARFMSDTAYYYAAPCWTASFSFRYTAKDYSFIFVLLRECTTLTPAMLTWNTLSSRASSTILVEDLFRKLPCHVPDSSWTVHGRP